MKSFIKTYRGALNIFLLVLVCASKSDLFASSSVTTKVKSALTSKTTKKVQKIDVALFGPGGVNAFQATDNTTIPAIIAQLSDLTARVLSLEEQIKVLQRPLPNRTLRSMVTKRQ